VKKLCFFVVLICLLILTCGDEEQTRLNVVFGQEPEGGRDVTELICIVVGRLEGGTTPIQAKLEGWWAESIGQNELMYGSDTWTFRTQNFEELPLILQAPQGYVFVGYFWFICSWTDENGTYNEIFSDTAHCYH